MRVTEDVSGAAMTGFKVTVAKGRPGLDDVGSASASLKLAATGGGGGGRYGGKVSIGSGEALGMITCSATTGATGLAVF